ncbi:MAG: DUF2691 family protein [Bacillota bacterium]
MRRGVRFKVPNRYGRLISDILKPVDCRLYYWHINSDEIYISGGGEFNGKSLFNENILQGKDFVDIINSNDYVMIFAEFKAFPDAVSISEISTYQDFINSTCQLIVLVVDSVYIDIYCKNDVIVEKLFENTEDKGYKEIEYIDESDTRTRMYVW